MNDFSKLTLTELEGRLKTIEEELKELEEEKSFVLKQTGIHLPGRTVRKYEAQTNNLQTTINALKEEIKTKKGA